MAVSSTYSVSQLGPNFRLDSSYYEPQYFDNRRLLQGLSWPLVRLGDVAYITNGQTPREADLSVGEVLFLTAESVHDLHIDYASAKRISSEYHKEELKRTILKENDMLVTIKGKTGNAAVVVRPPGEININQDVARVVLLRRALNPFYVSAFIVSKYGRLQVQQLNTDQINPFLGLGNLQRIQIPVAPRIFQEQIEAVVRQAHASSVQSQDLYRQAEQLLLDDLRFQKLDLADEVADEAPLSASLAVSRLDSEYFESKYLKLGRGLDGYADKVELGTISTFSGGATPLGSDYVDKGIPFLRIQNVGENYLLLEDVVYVSLEIHNGLLKRSKLRPGDVLITITGRIGTSAIIPDDLPTANINQHIVRIRLQNDLNPYYLSTYLNSPLGRLQALRKAYGTTRDALPYYRLGTLQILLASDTVQQRVEETVRRAYSVRKQAQTLLEQAKHKVEAMIESEVARG